MMTNEVMAPNSARTGAIERQLGVAGNDEKLNNLFPAEKQPPLKL
jgi:hypothetical protein